MSKDTIERASATNLSDDPATVLLSASDLKALLSEVKALRDEVEVLRKIQKTFALRTTNEIDELFAKIDGLAEGKKAGKKQADRVDILRALLAAHDGKMIAKDARRKMGLGESTFSRLLATMGQWIETRPLKTTGRGYLLILKTKEAG